MHTILLYQKNLRLEIAMFLKMQFGDNSNWGIYLYIACNKPITLLFSSPEPKAHKVSL